MTLFIALLIAAHPCLQDARKLCAGVKPGQGRIGACLKQHEADLSAECKEKRAEFREEAESCQADLAKLCPNAKAGKERAACMREHRNEISPECKEFFNRIRENREGMRSCRTDAQKLCKDVKPGEGRILECLKEHQADLSPQCAEEMK
jgi:uncharacterized coiled-coil DUF342 family protein